MVRSNERPGVRGPQRARNVQEKHHDTYVRKAKAPDSLECDGCGVVRHGGRWYWGAAPFGEVHGGLCPACQRIRDKHPAGTIHLPEALLAKPDEIRRLVRAVDESERAEHPLERVMALEYTDDGMLVTTTGIHIARRIASRLQRHFHKKPRIEYGNSNGVRVSWDA